MKASSPSSPADHPAHLVRLGAVLWLCVIATVGAGIPLTIANISHIGSLAFPFDYFAPVLAVVNASVGFLIIRFQPRLRIGWLFVAIAIPFSLSFLAQSYALFGIITAPESELPGLVFAAWLQSWLQFLAFPIPFALLFILFPNGRLPSRKWRWVIGVALIVLTLQVTQEMFRPGLIRISIADQYLALPALNPTGTRAIAILEPVWDLTWLISLGTFLAGAVSQLARYRNAGWTERQQLKWLVLFMILFLILLPFSFLGGESLLEDLALTLLIFMLPAGTTIAILRHNLYGIDIIIRRTLQYTLLTGILAGVYLGLVLVLQSLFTGLSSEQSPLVLVISTLTIAALFNPLRLRVQEFIDRRFFREKYDAERILERFALTIRSQVDIEHLGAAVIDAVEDTVQPERISLWVVHPEKSRE